MLSLYRIKAFSLILLLLASISGSGDAFLPRSVAPSSSWSAPALGRHRRIIGGVAVSASVDEIVQTTTATEIRLPRYDYSDKEEDDEEEESTFSYPSALHSIYVASVLTDEEAVELVHLARSHAAATGRWDQPDRDRHATYPTCDFPIDEAPHVDEYLQSIGFDDRIWTMLHEFYGVPVDEMSYLDLFCAQYRAKSTNSKNHEDDGTMDSLEAHRDGSLLSFTITLSDPTDFEGGGTFFEALRGHDEQDLYVSSFEDIDNNNANKNVLHPGGVIRPIRAGDCVFHSGKPLHGAQVVTSGERIVLVGFVDVSIWRQRHGVLAEACKTWGRMDVAEKRHQRQLQKAPQQQTNISNNDDDDDDDSLAATKGWFFKKNRYKWLPGSGNNDAATTGQGRSYISNYCPAFASAARRADPNFQRQQRLIAEDRLLRRILLSNEEVEASLAEFSESGDITIL